MQSEDIIFFTVATLVLGGFAWLVIWSIGRSRTILHEPATYYENARTKMRGLSDSFFEPTIKRPLWLARLPHLRDAKMGRSLFLVTPSEIIIHAKARFFWEIVSPNGPAFPYVVLTPFQVVKFADIDNYTYSNEGTDGWVLRLNLKDGESKVYTHCANNKAFKETLGFFESQFNK